MTCYFHPLSGGLDSRIVVFAREVREGESSEVDVDKAVHNQFFGFGTDKSHKDRAWDVSYLRSYTPPTPTPTATPD
jgi:hypothetical protein